MSGFEPPNYTQAPNAFFDKLLSQIDNLSELKVTLAVMRYTMGFHRDAHELSVGFLVKYTGLSRPSVVDGLKRAMKRGTVTRKESGNSFAYSLKVVKNLNQSEDTGSKESLPEVVKNLNPRKKEKESTDKESNDSLSGGDQKAAPMEMGAYGISELMQRVSEARQRGSQIDSPTNSERKDYGAQFRQCAKDGVDVDLLLTALDYMVAKASGAVENEAKAWCGFRTALDRVREGWRAPRHLRAVSNPAADDERDREWAEIEAMTAEILGGIG